MEGAKLNFRRTKVLNEESLCTIDALIMNAFYNIDWEDFNSHTRADELSKTALDLGLTETAAKITANT